MTTTIEKTTTIDTALTGKQIDALTAIASGNKVGRSNTKDRAIARLRAALIDRIGDATIDVDLGFILSAAGPEVATGNLRGVIDEAEHHAAPKPAPADDSASLDAIIARGRAKADKAAADQAAPKPAADGPRPGTRRRKIFEMLRAPGGATPAEMKTAGLGDVSISIYAQPFAEKYGYTVTITPEGRTKRFALTPVD